MSIESVAVPEQEAPKPSQDLENTKNTKNIKNTPAESPLQAKAAYLAGKPWFWALLVGSICTLMLTRAFMTKLPEPPQLRLPLPVFTLTDQRGLPFGTEQLKGKVWVADFVFTTCPTVCPKLTERMAYLQKKTRHMGDGFHLITFTVDPETDTPERLAAYAKANRAYPHRWTFLTGSLGQVEETVVKGFKLAMGKEETSPGIFSIFHGERLVLVDQEASIRGYYEANDEGIAQILRDIHLLANLK